MQTEVLLVVPIYNEADKVSLIAAAVRRHDYALLVVDDGSSVPPEVPEHASNLDVNVHVQEDRGFGLARARNLGARAAQGEILVFIDCDMMPEAQHIEAHARWHHAVSDALVFGFRWHADFSDLDAETVAAAVVDDNHLVRTGIAAGKRGQALGRQLACIASRDDDGDLRGLFHLYLIQEYISVSLFLFDLVTHGFGAPSFGSCRF